MVKVLLFQLFPSHNVVPCSEEPLAVISAGDDFLVPTLASLVNIYSKKGESLGRFNTTDSILALRYLPVIDTVVVLETNAQKQRFMRLYRGWRPSSCGLSFTTVNVPPSALAIATCPATARIIVAWARAVSLWTVTDEAKLDVQFTLQVDTSSPPLFIALQDSYLAYATATEMTVLDVAAEQRKVEQSNSLETPMRKHATVVLDASNNVLSPAGATISLPTYGLMHLTFMSHIRSLDKTAAKSQEPLEVIGVQLRDMTHAAFANVEKGHELTRCHTLLFRRFAVTERITSLYLRSLSPVPSAAQMEHNEIPAATEVQLFVSTKQCGYLYQLASPSVTRTRLLTNYLYTGDTSAIQMGDLFLYTLSKNGLEVWTLRATTDGEEAEQPPPCIVNMQGLMYVQQTAIANDLNVLLMSKSISEIAPKGSKSKPVAAASSSTGRLSAASPPPKLIIDDFVMISVRPKLWKYSNHVSHFSAHVREPFLFLLDREARKTLDVAWNIQLLEAVPLMSLAAEMRAYGAEKAESNPSVIYQLSVEIFLLFGAAISVRLARCRLLPLQSAQRMMLWDEVRSLAKEHSKAATELADHYIRTTKAYETAAHLFAHSDLAAPDVLTRLYGSDDIERRLRGVAAYMHKTGKYEVLSKEQADQLIAYLAAHTPGVLPPLLLSSRISSFDQAALLQALEPVMALEAAASGEMVLSCAMLAFECGADNKGLTALRSLDVDSLYRLLSNFPALFQPKEGRAALWRALSQEFPWSLLEALEKHRTTVTIGQALTVLGGAPLACELGAQLHSSDVLYLYLLSTLQAGHADATHSLSDTALLLALLLLRDVQAPRALPPAVLDNAPMRRSGSFSSFSTSSPKHTPPSSPRSAAAAAEARAVDRLRASLVRDRRRWLDSLPPFALQQAPQSDPFLPASSGAPPPAFFFLRKLQALLCSQWAKYIDFKRLVEAVNDAKTEFPGRFSLRLLCLPRCGALAEVAPSLVAAYPALTSEYGETVCQSVRRSDEMIFSNEFRQPSDWNILCTALLQATVSPKRQIRVSGLDTSPAKYFAAYAALLESLTVMLAPADFVSVLPPNGSVSFFMPYVERCHRHTRAELLRKRVVDEQLTVMREEERAAQQSS